MSSSDYAGRLRLNLRGSWLELKHAVRVVELIDLIAAGEFARSREWRKAREQVHEAVTLTDWPHGSGRFTVFPGKHQNGVLPIKKPCLERLKKLGWRTEEIPRLPGEVLTPGDLDGLFETPQGCIGFEWETGNISSSHRAINKLLLTLHNRGILGGILVVPSQELYRFLTDRVGNIGELRPYFPLWQATPVANGCLQIVVAEHDAVSKRVRKIPKGTDGRARR